MKILHIFGVVLAVHLGVFLVIFAVPGCRTTARKAPPTPADTVTAADAVAPAPVEGPSDLAAVAPLAESAPPPVAAPAGATAPVPADATVRFSPLRPGAVTPGAAPTAEGVTPARTHVVVRGDSLWTVARRYNLTVAEVAEANRLSPSATLAVGQKLLVPAPKRAAATTAPSGDDARVHVVKGGDTLGTIARQHGTTIATLKRLNGLKSDLVRVGQRLTVPEPGMALPEPSVAKPAPPAAATVNANGALVHVVKPGESLDSIRKLYGVTVGALATANNIADPSRIRPGQELVIPGRKATAPVAVPASASSATPADASSPFLPVATPANESPLTPAPEVPVIQVQETPKGGDAVSRA
ncbi:MAG: LysM peptidoglycan-binding domain-containing protein [Verrucomicrobia bacterium]|nr:LysM peptidoglycan-binding domain-containing protein [Verrucomicrobiota bacterium]